MQYGFHATDAIRLRQTQDRPDILYKRTPAPLIGRRGVRSNRNSVIGAIEFLPGAGGNLVRSLHRHGSPRSTKAIGCFEPTAGSKGHCAGLRDAHLWDWDWIRPNNANVRDCRPTWVLITIQPEHQAVDSAGWINFAGATPHARCIYCLIVSSRAGWIKTSGVWLDPIHLSARSERCLPIRFAIPLGKNHHKCLLLKQNSSP